MASLLSILQSNNDKAKRSVLALSSFRDYCVSTKNKILEWISPNVDSSGQEVVSADEVITIALPAADSATEKVVAYLSQADYLAALKGDVDTLTLQVNDTVTDTVTVASDVVLNAVENAVTDAQLTAEFISYTISNETVKATEFVSSVCSKFTSISAQAIEKYSTLLECGDAFTALRGFLSTVNNRVLSKQSTATNEYISVKSSLSYTGVSLADVAWTQFGNKVGEIFSAIWNAITKIFHGAVAVWEALKDVTMWFVGKVFKPLTTRFEVGHAPTGILDVPLMQLDVGYVDDITDEAVFFRVGHQLANVSTEYLAWCDNTHRLTNTTLDMRLSHTAMSAQQIKIADNMIMHFLFQPCFENIDGEWYCRPYDLVVPGSGDEVSVVRMGITEDNRCVIAMYGSIPKGWLNNYSDKLIATNLCLTFYHTLENVARECACLDFDTNPVSQSSRVRDLVATFFSMPSSGEGDDNYDLVAKLHAFDTNVVFTQSQKFFIRFGLLPYLARRSPILDQGFNGTVMNLAGQYATMSGNTLLIAGQVGALDSFVIDKSFVYEFKPFIQNTMLGVSVHYQTVDEQAAEIWHYVLAVVVAAVAAFIAVKTVKFVQRRQALAQIRQGYVDNMAWNLPQNPSQSELNAYLKAKKVSRRTNKLNNLLGISSAESNASSITDTVFAVFDRLNATQANNGTATSSINRDVNAVSGQVGGVSSSVSDVATAVQILSGKVDKVASSSALDDVNDKVDDIKSKVSDVPDGISTIIHLISGQ